MAQRLTCDINKTSELTLAILQGIITDDTRVMFYTPSGMGEVYLTRVRTHISRHRSRMRKYGKKMKHFRLKSSVHPETHGGTRFDCVICFKYVNDIAEMSEMLEDVMANG